MVNISQVEMMGFIKIPNLAAIKKDKVKRSKI